MKDLKILDQKGMTNMLFTDGRKPSEFTDSNFNGKFNNYCIREIKS